VVEVKLDYNTNWIGFRRKHWKLLLDKAPQCKGRAGENLERPEWERRCSDRNTNRKLSEHKSVALLLNLQGPLMRVINLSKPVTVLTIRFSIQFHLLFANFCVFCMYLKKKYSDYFPIHHQLI